MVGCNYKRCGEIRLRGCVNDAFAFAQTLVSQFHFSPEDVILLVDEVPAAYTYNAPENAASFLSRRSLPQTSGSRSGLTVQARALPERGNIVAGLRWLVSEPADELVFYFAGHALQLDDLSGWEGQGYDEAILPLDCSHATGEVNALTLTAIKSILDGALASPETIALAGPITSVDAIGKQAANGTGLLIVLDTTGGQTVMDVTGTGKWGFIPGVIQKGGFWPFLVDPSNKMKRAAYNSKAWLHKSMQERSVRPRYVPGIPVRSVADIDASIPSQIPLTSQKGFPRSPHPRPYSPGGMNFGMNLGCASRGSQLTPPPMKGHLLAAAPYSTVALEGALPPLLPSLHGAVTHGLFTWTLIVALRELCDGHRTTSRSSARPVLNSAPFSFKRVESLVNEKMQLLRVKGGFDKASQYCQLTFQQSSQSSELDPFHAPRAIAAPYAPLSAFSDIFRADTDAASLATKLFNPLAKQLQEENSITWKRTHQRSHARQGVHTLTDAHTHGHTHMHDSTHMHDNTHMHEPVIAHSIGPSAFPLKVRSLHTSQPPVPFQHAVASSPIHPSFSQSVAPIAAPSSLGNTASATTRRATTATRMRPPVTRTTSDPYEHVPLTYTQHTHPSHTHPPHTQSPESQSQTTHSDSTKAQTRQSHGHTNQFQAAGAARRVGPTHTHTMPATPARAFTLAKSPASTSQKASVAHRFAAQTRHTPVAGLSLSQQGGKPLSQTQVLLHRSEGQGGGNEGPGHYEPPAGSTPCPTPSTVASLSRPRSREGEGESSGRGVERGYAKEHERKREKERETEKEKERERETRGVDLHTRSAVRTSTRMDSTAPAQQLDRRENPVRSRSRRPHPLLQYSQIQENRFSQVNEIHQIHQIHQIQSSSLVASVT